MCFWKEGKIPIEVRQPEILQKFQWNVDKRIDGEILVIKTVPWPLRYFYSNYISIFFGQKYL